MPPSLNANSGKKFRCKSCRGEYTTKPSAEEHMCRKSHKPDNRLFCAGCGFSCWHERAMRRHVAEDHEVKEPHRRKHWKNCETSDAIKTRRDRIEPISGPRLQGRDKQLLANGSTIPDNTSPDVYLSRSRSFDSVFIVHWTPGTNQNHGLYIGSSTNAISFQPTSVNLLQHSNGNHGGDQPTFWPLPQMMPSQGDEQVSLSPADPGYNNIRTASHMTSTQTTQPTFANMPSPGSSLRSHRRISSSGLSYHPPEQSLSFKPPVSEMVTNDHLQQISPELMISHDFMTFFDQEFYSHQ